MGFTGIIKWGGGRWYDNAAKDCLGPFKAHECVVHLSKLNHFSFLTSCAHDMDNANISIKKMWTAANFVFLSWWLVSDAYFKHVRVRILIYIVGISKRHDINKVVNWAMMWLNLYYFLTILRNNCIFLYISNI